MKKLLCLVLILSLFAAFQCRQYNGNLTCDNCAQESCPDGKCFFWNGGPFPHQEAGCYQFPADTCSSFLAPFKVYECSQCSGSCCFAITGSPVQCIPDEAVQYFCVFNAKLQILRQAKPIKNLDWVKKIVRQS